MVPLEWIIHLNPRGNNVDFMWDNDDVQPQDRCTCAIQNEWHDTRE